jgi:hypothetical protein
MNSRRFIRFSPEEKLGQDISSQPSLHGNGAAQCAAVRDVGSGVNFRRASRHLLTGNVIPFSDIEPRSATRSRYPRELTGWVEPQGLGPWQSETAKLGRPHMLRHSCGYYLADKGTDLRTMQDYLGHRDPKHTATTRASPGIGSRGCGDSYPARTYRVWTALDQLTARPAKPWSRRLRLESSLRRGSRGRKPGCQSCRCCGGPTGGCLEGR